MRKCFHLYIDVFASADGLTSCCYEMCNASFNVGRSVFPYVFFLLLYFSANEIKQVYEKNFVFCEFTEKELLVYEKHSAATF